MPTRTKLKGLLRRQLVVEYTQQAWDAHGHRGWPHLSSLVDALVVWATSDMTVEALRAHRDDLGLPNREPEWAYQEREERLHDAKV